MRVTMCVRTYPLISTGVFSNIVSRTTFLEEKNFQDHKL